MLNSLWPKRMVLQSDRAQPLVTAKKADGRLQGTAERTTREEDVMVTADADVPSASILRRGVPRRFG
jgi:hypothetical protein